MSARYADLLRSAKRHFGQRGVALLMAMLTLALMAEIAALVVADYGSTMELLVGRQDLAQSRWLARGAIDWARNVLAEDARTSTTDNLQELWATRIPPTAVEDGEVSGEIADLSGRFDLNSLVSGGKADAAQVEAYKRLLAAVGVEPGDAIGLAAALVDWLDSNDEVTTPGGAEASWYASNGTRWQPANAKLVDVDELRLVRGYTDDIVNRLRPVSAAFPVTAPVNVNTASAEVLVAVVNNLSLDDARALVANRQAAPFAKIEVFQEQLPPMAVQPTDKQVSLSTRYFLAQGRAKYGDAVTRMEVLLYRNPRWSEIIWQKVL